MKTAFIFAAGRGERLKPWTDTQPKALCTIHDIPLIEIIIQQLVKAGFKNIIINHAYLGERIRQHLGTGEQWNITLHYSPEPPGGLETGGAIIHARQLIGNAPFVTVNADIVTNYDFSHLSLPESSEAHLVLVNQPNYYAHADFGLTDENLLDNNHRRYTFSGISCYRPSVFDTLKPGRFSLTPLLRQLTNEGLVSGEHHQGQWLDIGSPDRLILANTTPNPFIR